jgi:Calpain family cysteine protease/RTX calcium-binding nonapeptide repeat (4 copies)
MLTAIKTWLGASRTQSRPRRATLDLETLGDRTLLSTSLVGGTLSIAGTGDHDTATVSRQYIDGVWWVRVNEQRQTGTFTFPAVDSWYRQSQVSRIEFNGHNGDDIFTNNTSIRSTANGGRGDDVLKGGTGIDALHGNEGYDQVVGGAGGDYLYGESGKDTIQAGAGIDHIYGGDGDDKLFGGSSYDYVYGESGNDFLDDGGGWNYIDGGADFDFNARVLALYGATMEDVQQAQSPTCSCLAAIQSVADTGRDLRNLITYLGVGDSGTNPVYRVRLFRDGAWRNFDIPFNGNLITNGGDIYDAVPVTDVAHADRGCEQQSWVTILQRAYLQAKGVNWRDWRDVDNNGRCNEAHVMKALTGRNSNRYDYGVRDDPLEREDRERIVRALAANKPVVVGTFDRPGLLSTERLIPEHSYSVVDTRTRADGVRMFTLRNPHGEDGWTDKDGDGIRDGADSAPGDALIELTWDDFRQSIEDYTING